MMDAKEIADVLTKHAAWLVGDGDGSRADFWRANLIGADLMGANLRDADLIGANLRDANLRGADFIGANLRDANLRDANLRGANLMGVNLIGADLMGANLIGADLMGANLRDADLIGANLRDANLRGANLMGALINWRSHDLLAEILTRDAGEDVGKRKVAGLILVSPDWCWDRFLAVDDPEREWAMSVLRKYVRDGDGAPDALREAKKEEVER